ncbi:hypothetical protein [Haladaptatus caseinilyticus]|uniref:hypothetical protein n=1 Tax=Haladaptatus caseinilyticus TaxID=2993314 RepID=UPI00224B1DDC|nr:hypothetical protein [Haladaptatus caseinilyticus]
MEPLPKASEIPAGWEQSPIRGDEIELEHQNGTIAVKAVRTTSADEWELEMEDSISNQYTTIRPVGQADTREQAVIALLALAEAVNDLRNQRGDVRPDDIVREVKRGQRIPV